MPTKTRRVRDHTGNPAEYTGVTKLGRQLGPGVREQRARKAKRTLALRRLRARLVKLVCAVAVVAGLYGWLTGRPVLAVAAAAVLVVGALFAVNRPTRRRKRGRK